MGESLIADNWSLQDIAELLTIGIDEGNAASITVDRTKDAHAYEPLPQAVIALEALFDLMTDIVLRDQILVDRKFTSTWTDFDTRLQEVAEAGVIRPYEFLTQAEKLVGPRDEFVNRLCITNSLRIAHEQNSAEWERTRMTTDGTLSATLWGGAGMLARAFINEQGYTPHPLRRRLFQQANVILSDEDATVRLVGLLNEKRASLSQSRSSNDMLYALRINMPPVPILIIREASGLSQLLQIALQMRPHYQELRDWLGEYHQALTASDPSDLKRFEKILRSISVYADSMAGRADSNAPTFTVGFSALKVTLRGHPIEALRNQFGLRATANQLMLAGTGYSELKKLLGFFDHRRSSTALKVIDHFGSSRGTDRR